FCVVEHGMGRARWDVRHMMLPRTSAACYWEDELHIGRINLLVPGDSDSPVQASCAERLTERGRQAVSGIREYAAEAHPGGDRPVDLFDRDHRLGSILAEWLGHTSLDHAGLVARPTFRQEQ